MLGIDVGGVIIKPAENTGDTSFFSDGYLKTPMIEGAFETIRHLNLEVFHGDVCIVSKCGERVEAKTRHWLGHHGFHDYTGIPPARLFFCRKRKDKAPICERVGVDIFIDDRLDVLRHLTTVERKIHFQATEAAALEENTFGVDVEICKSWAEVAALFE